MRYEYITVRYEYIAVRYEYITVRYEYITVCDKESTGAKTRFRAVRRHISQRSEDMLPTVTKTASPPMRRGRVKLGERILEKEPAGAAHPQSADASSASASRAE